jgi:hypothetical protein
MNNHERDEKTGKDWEGRGGKRAEEWSGDFDFKSLDKSAHHWDFSGLSLS